MDTLQLAMKIIRDNVQGKKSKNPFLKELPALDIVPYQGSMSSTSEGIEKIFEKAEKKVAEMTLPVVLLDEIGLAEVSPANPLKVLHSRLEPTHGQQPDVGVVGISNFLLDAAKMNRAIQLLRPDPSLKDLTKTAQCIQLSICKSTLLKGDDLEQLTGAYFKHQEALNRTHQLANFHGLRDFYYLVKGICRQLSKRQSVSPPQASGNLSAKADIWTKVLARNFGGLQKGLPQIRNPLLNKDQSLHFDVMEAIEDNLADQDARHLLLLTSSSSALHILQDMLASRPERPCKPRIMYGSQFTEDQTESYVYNVLSEIILFMENGGVLVLCNLDAVYGSLYDMLNQCYSTNGGKNYCRVAIGAHSNPLCRVSDDFRCIVIMDEKSAQSSDDNRAFLNRFEKQHLGYPDVLKEPHRALLNDLEIWVQQMRTTHNDDFRESDIFVGYNEDTLSSLVLHYHNKLQEGESLSNVLSQCKEDLLWIATPEAISRLSISEFHASEAEEISRRYYEQQHHGLTDALGRMQEEVLSIAKTGDMQGRQWINSSGAMKVLVTTFSSIFETDVLELFKSPATSFKVIVHKLGAYQSEKQLESHVMEYLKSDALDLLVLQCHAMTDSQHVLLAQFTLDRLWAESDFTAFPKHICMVIHLARDSGKDGVIPMPNFSFQCGWRQIMLDTLGSSALPFKILSSLSVQQLFVQELLSCEEMVRKHLSEALLASFPSTLRLQDETNHLVCRARENTEFVQLLSSIVLDHLGDLSGSAFEPISPPFHHRPSSPPEWLVKVACNQSKLRESRTFSKAILSHVSGCVRRILQSLLSFVQQHRLLPLLVLEHAHDSPDSHRAQLSRALLTKKSLTQLTESPEEVTLPLLERSGDGLSTFVGPSKRLPLSQLFLSRMEDHRSFFFQTADKLEFINSQGEEADAAMDMSLTSVLESASLLKPLAQSALTEVMDEDFDWITEYLEDFLEQKTCAFQQTLSQDLRFAFVCAMVEPFLPPRVCQLQCDLPDFAAHVHCAFWMTEPCVRPLLALCGLVSEAHSLCEDVTLASISSCTTLYKSWKNASVGSSHEISPEEKDTPDAVGEEPSQMLPGEQAVSKLLEILCNVLLSIVSHPEIGMERWNLLVCQFLSLSCQVQCYRPPSLYALRVCSDTVQLFGFCESVKEFIVALAQPTVGGFADEMITAALKFGGFATATQLGSDNTAVEFVVRFFANWLDAHADGDPPEVDKILHYLSNMEASSDKVLIAPVVHRILDHLEHHAKAIVDSGFGEISRDESSPILTALDSILARQSASSSLVVVVQDTFQKVYNNWRELPDMKHLTTLEKACEVVFEASVPSFRLLVAAAHVRAALEKEFECLSQTHLHPTKIRDQAAQSCKMLESCLALAATSEHASKDLWSIRQEDLKCYLANLVKVLPESSYLHSAIKTNAPSLQPAVDAALFLDGDIRKLVTPLALIPGYEAAQVACAALLAGNHKTEAVNQQIQFCSKDVRSRRATLCAFAQIFYLKSAFTARSDAEQHAVSHILSCVQSAGEKLPPSFAASAEALLKPCFNTSFLQQLTTEISNVQVVAVLLHLLAILSASATPQSSSPFVQLFMNMNPTILEQKNLLPLSDEVVVSSGETVEMYSCPGGCVFGPTTEELRSPRCLNMHCPLRQCSSKTVQEPTPVRLQTNAKERPDPATLTPDAIGFEENHARPLNVQIFDFLSDAVLLLGLATCPQSAFEGHCKQMAEHFGGSFKPANKVVTKLEERIRQRWLSMEAHLNTTSDEVSLVLHCILHQCADLLVEGDRSHWLKLWKRFKDATSSLLAKPVQLVQRERRKFFLVVEPYCKPNELDQLRVLQKVTEADEHQPATPEGVQVPRLFRQTVLPSEKCLLTEFFSDPCRSKSYPVTALFLQRREELALLIHLQTLLRWNKLVMSALSGRQTRSQLKKTSVDSFLDSVPEESRKALASEIFKAMRESWDMLAPEMKILNNKQPTDINRGSNMTAVFVNSDEDANSFFAVVSTLCQIHNSFLAAVMKLYFEMMPSSLAFLDQGNGTALLTRLSVLQATESNLIAFDEEELKGKLAVFSQVSPLYGLGKEVCFDFEQIERRIVEATVVQKSLLSFDESERHHFKFAGELFLTRKDQVTGIRKTVPQQDLPEHINLDSVIQNQDHRQQMKSELELMLSQLSQTGGDGEIRLSEYRQKWPFEPIHQSLEAIFDKVQLKHMFALYEAVEVDKEVLDKQSQSILNDYSVQSLPKTVLPEVIVDIKSKLGLRDCLEVLQRFAYRYLNSANHNSGAAFPSPDDALVDYVGDIYVWPETSVQRLLGLGDEVGEEHISPKTYEAAFRQKISEVFDANTVKFAHTGHLLRELQTLAEVSSSVHVDSRSVGTKLAKKRRFNVSFICVRLKACV